MISPLLRQIYDLQRHRLQHVADSVTSLLSEDELSPRSVNFLDIDEDDRLAESESDNENELGGSWNLQKKPLPASEENQSSLTTRGIHMSTVLIVSGNTTISIVPRYLLFYLTHILDNTVHKH